MRTYVLAKNYQHFRYWCMSNGFNPNGPNVRYVDSVWTLRGVTLDDETEIVFYETWSEHPQALQIVEQVRMLESIRGPKGTATSVRSPQVMEETNGIFTALFWKRALERMIRAFFISLGAVCSVSVIFEDGFSWQKQLIAAGLAAFGSLVVAMGGSQFGKNSADPSFFNEANPKNEVAYESKAK